MQRPPTWKTKLTMQGNSQEKQETCTNGTEVPYKCPTASSATQVRIKAEDRVDDMSSIREGEKRASLPRKEHSNSVNRRCNSHWATSTREGLTRQG